MLGARHVRVVDGHAQVISGERFSRCRPGRPLVDVGTRMMLGTILGGAPQPVAVGQVA